MSYFSHHRIPFLAGLLLAPLTALILSHTNGIVLAILPSPTPTPTSTPTPTNTPTPQPTPTDTPIPTRRPTPLPTSIPTPTPIPVTSEQLDRWFTQYSNHYSIERSKLWKMAVCESNLHPNAKNGDYGGMYQFSSSTWKATRREMNEDPNPQLRFNPEEAIKTAAFKISTMGLAPWPNCGKK